MQNQNTNLHLEDLILRSRALALEEKQELLKKLDTIPEDKKEQMRVVLAKESEEFEKMDKKAMFAIQQFTQTLKTVTEHLSI